jgi:hypothetical protein
LIDILHGSEFVNQSIRAVLGHNML